MKEIPEILPHEELATYIVRLRNDPDLELGLFSAAKIARCKFRQKDIRDATSIDDIKAILLDMLED